MRAIVLLFTLMLTCSGVDTPVREVGATNLKEASGLEYANGILWTIQDSGNTSTLYSFDTSGKPKGEVIVDVANHDWESLASDAGGNLYIGDFGNNENQRTDLTINKVDKASLKNKRAAVSSVIRFSYPEQKDFSPNKNNLIYDCEAFVEHEGYFYLFTKNRSSNSDGSFMIYTVPNTAGTHSARYLGKLSTCAGGRECAITGADISPDGKSVILLTAQTLYKLEGFNGNDISGITISPVDLGFSTQKEGVCFITGSKIMIVDEKKKKNGGKLYEADLNDLESKR
jgi:hypothetical protein